MMRSTCSSSFTNLRGLVSQADDGNDRFVGVQDRKSTIGIRVVLAQERRLWKTYLYIVIRSEVFRLLDGGGVMKIGQPPASCDTFP